MTDDEKATIIKTMKEVYFGYVREHRSYWFSTVKREGITYSLETWNRGKTFLFSENIMQRWNRPIKTEWV